MRGAGELPSSPKELDWWVDCSEELVRSRLGEDGELVDNLKRICPETAAHLGRVAGLAAAVTAERPDLFDRAIFMGYFHDLGKFDSRLDAVRNQRRKYEPEERQLMNMHTIWGAEALTKLADNACRRGRWQLAGLLEDAAYSALLHHSEVRFPRRPEVQKLWTLGEIVKAIDCADARTQPVSDNTRSYLVLREPHLYTSEGHPRWGAIQGNIIQGLTRPEEVLPHVEMSRRSIVNLAFRIKLGTLDD